MGQLETMFFENIGIRVVRGDIRGHGEQRRRFGAPGVRRAGRLPFELRTDVRRSYASIDPVKIAKRVPRTISDPKIRRPVAALTTHTGERGGIA